MKTAYFSDQTIDNKSDQILRDIYDSRDKHTFNFLPSQSALIILDMQRYFLDEKSHAFIPSALPVISKINILATKYISQNLTVIQTRHINTKKNANCMASWWKELITAENELSELIPELQFSESIVIEKSQYDGFYRTSLDSILKKKGIKQLVVTGVMTHLCCESTCRSAFSRGYSIYFPVDCTASYNEDFHRATFLNLSHGFVFPVLMKELIERW